MPVNYGELLSYTDTGVVWLRFHRRRPKPEFNAYRRMVASTCYDILMSNEGRMTLNYRPTNGQPAYNPYEYNLIPVWDLLVQDYRMIPVDEVEIDYFVEAEHFWQIFKYTLAPMTGEQKTNWMNMVDDPNVVNPEVAEKISKTEQQKAEELKKKRRHAMSWKQFEKHRMETKYDHGKLNIQGGTKDSIEKIHKDVTGETFGTGQEYV